MPTSDDQLVPGQPLELFAIAPSLYADGCQRVDTGAMKEAAEWMAGRAITDMLVTGSYGEFQSLADDERVDILRAVRTVTAVGSVMACAAHPSTDATVQLARRLADEGADLVMIAAPIAAEVTVDELLRHFSVVAERVTTPLVVYNNPVFGVDLAIEVLERIVSLEGFRAVKQGTPSLRSLARSVSAVHDASGGRASVFAASDVTGAAALYAGADGLTSTNCWAFPEAISTLVASSQSEQWGAARRVAAALEPYFSLVQRLGQPRTIKAAMHLRGLPGGGRVRLPYVGLDHEQLTELERVLDKCDAALSELGVSTEGERR